MVKKSLQSAFALLILAPLFGCLPQDDEVEAEEEEVGEAQLAALGDISCVNGTADRIAPDDCNVYEDVNCTHYSADNTYGNDFLSGEDCQPYFVVQNETPGWGYTTFQHLVRLSAFPWAMTMPTTQASCERTHIELAGYVFDQNGNNWELVDTEIGDFYWFNGACYYPFTTVDVVMDCDIAHQCKVAPTAAVRVYTGNPFGLPTYHRVGTGALLIY